MFVQPAGAQLRSAPDEEALIKVWDEVGKCLGYPKPDGWRIQIHKQGSDVKLFSRSGKNWTKEFPDIIQVILSQVKDDQIILDTELVGFDRHGRHLAPSKLRDASQYRCYILDALYFGGENLTSLPTQKRVRLMKDHLLDSFNDILIFAEYSSIEAKDDFVKFYQQCQARKAEGFDGTIIKQLDTQYFTDVLKVRPEETVEYCYLPDFPKCLNGIHKEQSKHCYWLCLVLSAIAGYRLQKSPGQVRIGTPSGQRVSLLFRMIAPTIWKGLLVCLIFGLRPRL